MLMALPFFYQSVPPSMSPHHPPDHHQVAPFANMTPSCNIPAKRGPEDDVQFVAAHPVQRCRDSREQPLTLIQQTSSLASPHPQKPAVLMAQAVPDQLETCRSGAPAASPPQRSARGTSLPTMNDFAFPPPTSGNQSHTSQSSPLLSPRQLPPSMLSEHTHANMETSTADTTTAAGSCCSVSQKEITMPWHTSGLSSHLTLLDHDLILNQPAGLAPFQSPNSEKFPAVGDREEAKGLPDVTKPTESRYAREDGVDSQGQETLRTQGPAVDDMRSEAEQWQANRSPASGIAPYASTSEAQADVRPTGSAAKETGQETHPQEKRNDGNDLLSNPQPPVSQPPCLACEQKRQNAMFNQGNGYLIGHQPHLQHPWHGQGLMQHQVHMGQQLPGSIIPGPSMAPNASQNIQPGVHPVPTNQAPLGYIHPPQVQSQIPVTLARPFTSAGMLGPESLQSVLPSNQGQQVSSGHASQFSSPLTQQMMQPQYLQSQLHPFQRPLVVSKSFMAPSLVTPTQASVFPSQHLSTAPISRPPTPAEPREHSPNLIVDIAETCEDFFPWEEVAQRHKVPRQKVMETFSAVVQLPLLRCTTDKRRHGNLATSRLRQYTKAKRDVEAAKASSSPSPPPPPPPRTAPPAASNQTQTHSDRAILPVVWEMANTMAPLGLPSSITDGLAGAWQR